MFNLSFFVEKFVERDEISLKNIGRDCKWGHLAKSWGHEI